MKKVWEKPKLVVLVRSKSEESVLAQCKIATTTGANEGKAGCRVKVTGQCTGVECSTISAT